MSDEEKIQIAALGLLGLFGLTKKSGNAERQRQEAEAEAERQRQEAEAERKAEEARKAEEERLRLEAEAEILRLEAERKAEEARKAEEERQRQEAEAERQRQEAEAKRKAEAERQRQEAEAERREAERREAERLEAEREKETFTFRNYLVKFWNMFDTVDKDRNGKLSKNELWTYLRANEQLKSDLGASVVGESARARLFQAMDENRDGTFSRMEFAVYCAHKLFGTKPIKNEVAIRQFHYSKNPDTGGWDEITQDHIDRYKREKFSTDDTDTISVPPLPPVVGRPETVESPEPITDQVLRDENGEKFPDVRKGYMAARRKYRGRMKGKLFETTDGVYKVTKGRGTRDSSQIRDEEYEKVTRPVIGPRINAFKPLQMKLRF